MILPRRAKRMYRFIKVNRWYWTKWMPKERQFLVWRKEGLVSTPAMWIFAPKGVFK